MSTDASSISLHIPSLQQAYQEGIRPAQVIEQVFARIAQTDDAGIFIDLFSIDQCLAQCDSIGQLDLQRMPLWGVPFVVKDNIDVAGASTSAGCPAFASIRNEDARVVSLLRAAGAILIGKTNLDQFATGLVGTRTPFPVPRNAVDPALVPGGSSSGSAVAVSQGIVSFALGTDTAGSGRVPAALNNIVGLKPSLGLISANGVVPACRTLDTVSVFALTPDDAYRVLSVSADFDADDPFSRDIGLPKVSKTLKQVLPGFGLPLANRVFGVPDTASLKNDTDPEQVEMFEESLRLLESLGATIEPIDFEPFFTVADLLYSGSWVAERYVVIESLLKTDPDAIHPVTRKVIEPAARLSAAQTFRDVYRLRSLQRKCMTLMHGLSGLCVPSVATMLTCQQDSADPIAANNRLGRYTNFVNMLDMAAIAVPVKARTDGWPGGITLIGRPGSDCLLAAMATAIQSADQTLPGTRDWPLPQISTEEQSLETADNELAIAAVGAHMSGMPLNNELIRLGARKLADANTSDGYRLYALAGGPPYRPGLVRDPDGASIALEVWALPTSQVGEFLAGIPAPLGLGKVELRGGQQVTGFICESAGIDGARDVTSFGGWRAYIQSLSTH